MQPWQILLIIAIALIFLIIIITASKRKKQNKTNYPSATPMEAPSADTLNLVEQAKAEALREIEEERAKRTENHTVNGEITPDMLEDLLSEDFSDMTFTASESFIDNPMPKKKITEDEFVKIKNHPEDIIENALIPEDIKAYLSNGYSLSGETLSDNTITKTNMTICKGNARLGADFDGRNVDIILFDNDMYIVNTDKNTYIEITDSFLKLIGKRKEDIIPASIGVSAEFASILPKVYSALIDGEENICYEYKSDERIVRLYTKDNKLKLIITLNSEEKTDIIIKTESFEANPDINKLSTDGIKKVGAIAFFKDFLK